MRASIYNVCASGLDSVLISVNLITDIGDELDGIE